jgi:hypothetical protein
MELEKIKRAATSLLYFYQRVFWYISQAKGEALKPLGFWNETLLILTFLSVRFKADPGITQVLVAYLIVLAAAAIIGKVIVTTGIPRYNTKINNDQNPQLMEILRKVEELEKIIKNGKNNE